MAKSLTKRLNPHQVMRPRKKRRLTGQCASLNSVSRVRDSPLAKNQSYFLSMTNGSSSGLSVTNESSCGLSVTNESPLGLTNESLSDVIVTSDNCCSVNRLQVYSKRRKISVGWLGLWLTLLAAVTVGYAAKEIPMVDLTVVQGDPVYMPCDISTQEENDAVVIVLWYKGELGTPIYTVDTRDRSILLADRWSDDSVFANRAYFMPEKQPAELGIDSVRDTDTAIYRCRVDFRRAQTRNSKVNLTVIVPPHEIIIRDENGKERKSVVGPYSEGADLRLICEVHGGKPPPSVSWMRRDVKVGRLISDSGPYIKSEVAFHHLQRSDLHSELTCVAKNNNRTQPLTATVHIDMNFPPLDVRILGSSQALSANRRYDLLCQSSGSRPPASITWWKNGQRLEKTKETTSVDGNTTTSTLSFTPSKDDAGKYLSCRAENTILAGDDLEDGWKLEIFYAPEAQIELGKNLNLNAIREGTDVYFDCIISAEPSVDKVEWRHNGKPLHHSRNLGVIVSNQSLVLQGVSRSSAGNYSCVGMNSEGNGESAPFFLNILYAPTCKPNQTRVHGVAKHEKANISCVVDANPADVSFKWSFNNSAESIDVTHNHISKFGTRSMVTYTPVTEMDYGTLLCWARNPIGDQRVPCVFHIIAAGRPDTVTNCSVANMSMSSFAVQCGEGFNGGLPQTFLLEVRELHTQELRANTSATHARFHIGGLEPGSQYHAVVYSFNDKGRSEPAILLASTLRLPEKQLTSEREKPMGAFRMTPLMTVASIVVGALLLVVAAIIIVLRLQCARAGAKRRKATQEAGGSPASKLDQSGCESGDSDDKNPDVVPQPDTVEEEDRMDFVHKRQHISTIETTSPTRGLLAQGLQGPGPQGYCTLRNGMPLRDMSHHHHAVVAEMSYPGGACTLPRNPWSGAFVPQKHAGNHLASPPMFSPRVPQPIGDEEATPETPLMLSKRESTV